MKYILIAIYMSHGSMIPEMRTRIYIDKSECQKAAEKYIKSINGQSRAFCLKEIIK